MGIFDMNAMNRVDCVGWPQLFFVVFYSPKKIGQFRELFFKIFLSVFPQKLLECGTFNSFKSDSSIFQIFRSSQIFYNVITEASKLLFSIPTSLEEMFMKF